MESKTERRSPGRRWSDRGPLEVALLINGVIALGLVLLGVNFWIGISLLRHASGSFFVLTSVMMGILFICTIASLVAAGWGTFAGEKRRAILRWLALWSVPAASLAGMYFVL